MIKLLIYMTTFDKRSGIDKCIRSFFKRSGIDHLVKNGIVDTSIIIPEGEFILPSSKYIIITLINDDINININALFMIRNYIRSVMTKKGRLYICPYQIDINDEDKSPNYKINIELLNTNYDNDILYNYFKGVVNNFAIGSNAMTQTDTGFTIDIKYTDPLLSICECLTDLSDIKYTITQINTPNNKPIFTVVK